MLSTSWETQSVIVVALEGVITLQHLQGLGSTVQTMLNESHSNRVHLVMDQTRLEYLPQQPNAVRRALNWLNDSRFAALVTFGSYKAANTVQLQLAADAHHIPFASVPTRDEALLYLRRLGYSGNVALPHD